MDLYYNREKVSNIPITKNDTIGHVKKSLNNWLRSQNIFATFIIRFKLNNNTELDPVVFQTENYDEYNLEQYQHYLSGGSINIYNVKYCPCPYMYVRGIRRGQICSTPLYPNQKWCKKCVRKNLFWSYIGNGGCTSCLPENLKDYETFINDDEYNDNLCDDCSNK